MTKIIIRVILVTILFGTTIHLSYGQTDWQSYQSQEPLPKGAKLQTINYSQMYEYGRCSTQCYTIEGFVLKGSFVNNQKISILDVNGKNIISGNYYTKDDGYSYIDGNCYVDNKFNQTSPIQGLFKVSNKQDGIGITVRKKESTNLFITMVDITNYQKNIDNNTVLLQKLPDGTYSYKIKYAKNENWVVEKNDPLRIVVKKEDWVGANTMEVPISLSSIQKLGLSLSNYDFSKEIAESNQVKISYNDGSIFIGTVNPFIGVRTFTNGEVFEGEFAPIRYVNNVNFIYTGIYAPYKGKTIFADGSVSEGVWLEKYDFYEEEFEKIFPNTKSLTDMRDNLVRIRDEKRKQQQEKEMLIEEVEAVLDNDYYSDNCHSVEVLDRLYLALDKLENKLPLGSEDKKYLSELKKDLILAYRQQVLTKKHGATTAKKIIEGKYEIGMSKEVVYEILSNNRGLDMRPYYEKSESSSSETWSLKWGVDSFDITIMDMQGIDRPTLIIRNGKLTNIIR